MLHHASWGEHSTHTLTDLMIWCCVKPILASATEYSPVRVQFMTPGSSEFREKLTPSLAKTWMAWSSNVLELVKILDVGHVCKYQHV